MRVVVINNQVRTVVVPSASRPTVVYARSAPGPAGPPGPSGAGYVHDQASASDTWTINHNLGIKPVVEAFTPGGLLMMAEVLHTSFNQTVLSFNIPTAGFARLV
jgi:hypothetical protein